MNNGNTKIPWEEFVSGHNRLHGTTFTTPRQMLSVLYRREGTLEKVGKILGIAGWTVGVYMRLWGLPRLPKGHRGNSEYQVAFRNINNVDQYTGGEIAGIVGCSVGYITCLKRSAKQWNMKTKKKLYQ